MRIAGFKQEYLNDLLKARNYGKSKQPVWFSEILSSLGMKHPGIPRYDKNGNIDHYDIDITQACGNVYDPENPNVSSRIDLRARGVYIQQEDGSLKKTIVMDPNVDGCVIGFKYFRKDE